MEQHGGRQWDGVAAVSVGWRVGAGEGGVGGGWAVGGQGMGGGWAHRGSGAATSDRGGGSRASVAIATLLRSYHRQEKAALLSTQIFPN